MGPAAPNEPFDLVFCDPPYGRELAGPALASCADGGWLKPDALVIVEENASATLNWPTGFKDLERRTYGDTQVAFGRYQG
jgi:16S rRNA (guanine966-N2)-methyltransferase